MSSNRQDAKDAKNGSDKTIRVRCARCGALVLNADRIEIIAGTWACPKCGVLGAVPAAPAPPPSMQERFEMVLRDVERQVLYGKGEERHGRGRPFGDQPTFKILDLVGDGYAAGQAIKKIEEALGILEVTPSGRYRVVDAAIGADREAAAEREFLGAIGYLAMLVARRRSRA